MQSLKDLKKLAKERGLRRYHNFKKAELLTLLEIPIPPSKGDLKKLAKERGLRRYHNLKKSELLTSLEIPISPSKGDFSERPIPAPRKKFEERPIPAPRNIMNIRNPKINIPILQPEIAVVKESQAPSFIEKTIETFSDWMNWLAESGKIL